jgi:hypothetical protein
MFIIITLKDKEERCRDKFDKNSMFMKMPRNPINGEKTSREDADYAIPFHHSLMLKIESQKSVQREVSSPPKLTRFVDQRDTTFARPNPLVETVRQRIDTIKQPHLQTLKERRVAMENEINQFQQLVEYKKAMIAQSAGSAISSLPY